MRIAADMPMAVVGAPSYFARHAPPITPQSLVDHACLNLRFRTASVLYPWTFERQGRELNVRVHGPLVFNNIDLIRDAALAGFGLAYLPVDQVCEHLDDGGVVSVLDDWCPGLSGYHLYYPNLKPPAAFALLIEAPRYKG